jgi:hypothetical protein
MKMPDERIQILTVSLSYYLTGHRLEDVIKKDWTKSPDQAKRFMNVAFDFDGENVPTALHELKEKLLHQHWDGILVGWCIRGKPQHTTIFEDVIELCRSLPQETKILFCTGPDDLMQTTLRNFP